MPFRLLPVSSWQKSGLEGSLSWFAAAPTLAPACVATQVKLESASTNVGRQTPKVRAAQVTTLLLDTYSVTNQHKFTNNRIVEFSESVTGRLILKALAVVIIL